eukprot:CAMPEP_0203914232 /NCGR_PEP_ID=MMETSP0359-20131031/55139_1 /ASSEMBLY_ACC=CAM_ASM_000338 /TAXON_ID=268821 /ORGANISM="Scrippsiella Hangoei, Strain SHTV-5" /LENGTH=51 /DNA_ID=CAMNT_0050840519 /DNA_START=116 /DNA_END=268 /DNA_ORIENTATION=+
MRKTSEAFVAAIIVRHGPAVAMCHERIRNVSPPWAERRATTCFLLQALLSP